MTSPLPEYLSRMRALNDNEVHAIVAVPIGYVIEKVTPVDGTKEDRQKSIESFLYVKARKRLEFE